MLTLDSTMLVWTHYFETRIIESLLSAYGACSKYRSQDLQILPFLKNVNFVESENINQIVDNWQ